MNAEQWLKVAKMEGLVLRQSRDTVFRSNALYEAAALSVALLDQEFKRERIELQLMESDGLGLFASNSWYDGAIETSSEAKSRLADATQSRDAAENEARCSQARQISAERRFVLARATERAIFQKATDSLT